jgi:hypothetical protein
MVHGGLARLAGVLLVMDFDHTVISCDSDRHGTRFFVVNPGSLLGRSFHTRHRIIHVFVEKQTSRLAAEMSAFPSTSVIRKIL